MHREVHRVLKRNGTYMLSTPNYDHIDYFITHYRPLLFDPTKSHMFEHIRQYNLETHTKFLAECGFKVVDHWGADAHYSLFFHNAREYLKQYLGVQLGHKELTVADIDQVLGMCFPSFSHTIMILAKPM